MDPKQISDALIGIGGLIGLVMTGLSASQRKSRARTRRQADDLEAATAYILESRRQRRVHNDAHHPTGADAIDVPDLPTYLMRGEE